MGWNAERLAEMLGERLSPAQVRYALDPLLAGGYVVMVGGKGRKATVYSRA